MLILAGLAAGTAIPPAFGAEPAGAELEEIVITATRTPEPADKLPVVVNYLDRPVIETSGAANLGELLGGTAGVTVKSQGGPGSQVSLGLRGSTSEQALLLIDGRPLNLPASGLFDLGLFPMELVERVEVLRGPASAIYGANALSGVVNLITRRIPADPEFATNLSFGTFDTWRAGASFGRTVGRFGYLVGGSGLQSGGDRENSAAREEHLFGKASLNLGDNAELTLSLGSDFQVSEVPGPTAFPSPLAEQRTEEEWQELGYRFYRDAGEFQARLYRRRNRLHYRNPDPGWPVDTITRNRQDGLEIQNSSLVAERHQLTFGAGYLADRVDGDATGQHEPDSRNLYLQDQIDLGRLNLLLGGRYDDHSVFGSEFSPRLAGRVALNERTALRLAFGRSYRAPTVNELYWFEEWWPGAGSFGNAGLRPEKGTSYEAGLDHNFNRRVSLRTTYFQNEVKDLISWVEVVPWTRYETMNIGRARISGLETELRWEASPGLRFTASHTRLDTRDRQTGKELPYRPGQEFGLTGEIAVRGWNLYLKAGYRDPAWADPANTRKVEDHLLLGARLARQVRPGLEFFLQGENLLNENYEILSGYPMPGASFGIGINARF